MAVGVAYKTNKVCIFLYFSYKQVLAKNTPLIHTAKHFEPACSITGGFLPTLFVVNRMKFVIL